MKDIGTRDNTDILVSNEEPCVDILLEEWKQAGVMPNGFYDVAFNQETRRMIWAGQSPDGRKWDENMPEGEEARPWNGASDTRVPMVDGIINDDVAVGCVAFQRAELRATSVDPEQAELAAEVSKHLHWMVHTRYARMLALEVELSLQYSREHGFCLAYVGWEREVSKRRVRVDLASLAKVPNQYGPANPTRENGDGDDVEVVPTGRAPTLMELVMDPEQEAAAVVLVRELYRQYVTQELQAKGFFEEELEDSKIVEMSESGARKAVRQLREEGVADIPMAYACRNQPIVWVGQPFVEMLAARGTMELQAAPVVFWRRWMSEGDLKAKAASGWDGDWIAAVLKTKGNISTWAGALGATSLTGPSTKTVGSTTYLKVTEENNPLMEVIYAHRKVVDEDGVTGVWETIFSPHVTKNPNGDDVEVGPTGSDFCAKHELLNYAHGRYPYLELKRENIGRALVDSRSVSEIAATWQNEQKAQKDMLFNRSEMETLPPVQVPRLGGVGYRLGPGAQVPMNRNQKIEKALELGPVSPLAMELIAQSRLEAKEYFGRPDAQLDPSITAAKQAKMANDLYRFWGEVLAMMFALTVQYNPGEVDRVCNHPGLAAGLDVYTVLDELAFGLEFDIAELNPDYVVKKMEVLNSMVLPADAAGIIDRAKLTAKQVRMVDPRMAQELIQDQGSAAQKIYDEVDGQVARMALGNEAKYVENDPSAGTRLQYLQTVVQNNPKYQLWLGLPGQGNVPGQAPGRGADPRFKELMENYMKNLQMSVEQQQNKVVGRIGVKQIGNGMGQ